MGHTLFKIVTLDLWQAADAGTNLPPMSIDVDDGFLHLSTREQVEETLRLHFAGKGPLMLVALDSDLITDDLRWEPSRGGQLFPHVYGDVEKAAIIWAEPMEVAANGAMDLPEQMA
ncbi:MAG: DUF952 domain-containing protein [Hyphomicrobiaceae bacterium]|nr:DUF952 domain-containing protein [Hyphomicrobiaceae bacterium]MCC0022592.1 DUF952 domain-containing protein [Hyphomicrobiaceae bacterium]